MPLHAHADGLYLRSPVLHLVDGTPTLSVLGWDGAVDHLVRITLDADGGAQGRTATPLGAPVHSLDPYDGSPRTDAAAELAADDGTARVEVTHELGRSRVVLHRGGRTTLVFDAVGIAVCPAVASCDAGTYVAFHHDVREDDGRPDVAKWIAVRYVDAEGAVFEIEGGMPDRDRDREGVEQSFEFPHLVVGGDGAIALFGRGSHNFYRQDAGAQGFGPRAPRSDGEWGSRGRRVVALRVGDLVYVARREKKGIELSVEPAPSGGTPRFTPATVCVQSAPTPPADPRQDPAARYGKRTYFGDLQQHSAHSDGVGSADEAYLRARDRYGDDFVALTDHEAFLGKRTPPGEWDYLTGVADRYEQPGRFAAVYAYEWTGARYPGPGHKCVYVPRRDVPIVSRDEVPRGADLLEPLRAQGAIAAPHHIGWTGADPEGHAEDVVPVWEICSCHGCYEHADHPLGQRGELHDQLVDRMLARGLRFGFTASSDSHGLLYHHGECRKRDPYRTGLTAVVCDRLDRDAVLEALRARRCYATSGVKILLDVTVDGAPMGSFLTARPSVDVEVRAEGVTDLARIDLVTDAGTVASFPCSGLSASVATRAGGRYVYARVVQADGEMAWSSPVFLG